MWLQSLADPGFRLGVKLQLRQISAYIGVFTVRLVAVRVKPRQEIVHDKRSKEHVDADNSGSVFLNAPQITLFDMATVHLRIRAAHRFSVDEGHVVNPAAKETREAGLDIVHGAGDA